MIMYKRLLTLFGLSRKLGSREILQAEEQLKPLADKLQDRAFAEAFAKDPSRSLRESGLDFDVWKAMDTLSQDKVRYRKFLDDLSSKVEVNMLQDILAASTCDNPTL